MTKHAIVRLDNVAATKNGALIKSVKYMGSGSTPTAIDNGMFVEIGGLMDGEREVHLATTPKASSAYFGIVCTPEVQYDQTGDKSLYTYENEADSVSKVIIFQKGDIYSVTVEALDKAPIVGSLVELQASTKGKVVATATSGSTTVGKVIEVDVVGRVTYYVIEVQ